MIEKVPLPELHRFKAESNESDFHLYASAKKRVMRYRAIFFCLGIFFLILSWIIYQKSAFWFTLHFKPFVDVLAFGLGIASLTICTFLRYETEAVHALFHETRLRLKKIYKIRQSKSLKDQHLPLGDVMRKKLSLRAHFHQTLAKLKKQEHETLDLMRRISRTKSLDLPEKELLYNQALIELKEHFNPIVKAYEEEIKG